jgi:membrane dipeptidase
MRGSEQARALHAEHPAIDLHADTLMWSRWLGYDLHEAHEPPLWRAAFGGHVDLPRMRQGGVGAQFFGLVSLPVAERVRGLESNVPKPTDAPP